MAFQMKVFISDYPILARASTHLVKKVMAMTTNLLLALAAGNRPIISTPLCMNDQGTWMGVIVERAGECTFQTFDTDRNSAPEPRRPAL